MSIYVARLYRNVLDGTEESVCTSPTARQTLRIIGEAQDDGWELMDIMHRNHLMDIVQLEAAAIEEESI